MYLFFKYFTFDKKILCVCALAMYKKSLLLDLEQTQILLLCVCALAIYKKTLPFRFRVNSDIAPCPISGYEIRYLFLTKKKIIV